MQSLYNQRHAVIHYLTNASLQSWFKNRVELLIHSSFYECIKCQTVTNGNSLISFLREKTSKNRILWALCLMRGPDGGAHSQWRRKSCRCRLSILDHVKGLAIILQPKGDHLVCPQINKEPAGIITMHLMMLLFLWHALVKLMIWPYQTHISTPWNITPQIQTSLCVCVSVLFKTFGGITKHARYIMSSLLHLVFVQLFLERLDFATDSQTTRQIITLMSSYLANWPDRSRLMITTSFSEALGFIKQERTTFTWHF